MSDRRRSPAELAALVGFMTAQAATPAARRPKLVVGRDIDSAPMQCTDEKVTLGDHQRSGRCNHG